MNTLKNQLATLKTEDNNLRQQQDANRLLLNKELEPAKLSLQQTVNQLTNLEKAKAKVAELNALKQRFEKELDVLENPASQTDKYKPRERFEPSFFYGMTRNLQNIFRTANFQGADKAAFNQEDFDVTVAGYTKADEQGKGFSSFFNTVLILAFHAYLNHRSPNAPGTLLIDTPFHGFNQGMHDPKLSMTRGLFNHLAQQAKNQQIIILENDDKVTGINLEEYGNFIEFTKDRNNGSYGYLKDVYDLGEEDE